MEQPVPSKHSRRQGKVFARADWERTAPSFDFPEVLSPTLHPTSGPWAQPQQEHIPSSRVFPEPIRRRATEPMERQATGDGFMRRTFAKLRRSTSIAFLLKSPKSQSEDVPAAATSEVEDSLETPSTGVSSVFDLVESSEVPTTGTSSAFDFEECAPSPCVDEYPASPAAVDAELESARPPSTMLFTMHLCDDGKTAEFQILPLDASPPVIGTKSW